MCIDGHLMPALGLLNLFSYADTQRRLSMVSRTRPEKLTLNVAVCYAFLMLFHR